MILINIPLLYFPTEFVLDKEKFCIIRSTVRLISFRHKFDFLTGSVISELPS
jgi:hypothetical protein